LSYEGKCAHNTTRLSKNQKIAMIGS